jgi:hypothetical protein
MRRPFYPRNLFLTFPGEAKPCSPFAMPAFHSLYSLNASRGMPAFHGDIFSRGGFHQENPKVLLAVPRCPGALVVQQNGLREYIGIAS